MEKTMNNGNIPIFLASNDKYAPFVATTMASICYNTKSFIEFYVLDGGITNFRKKQIESLKGKFNNFSIEFIKIDFEKYFNGFKKNNYWSLDMYSRFLIPLIKTNISKAIYLDVDVIALNDVNNLYQEILDNYILGAIPEDTDFKVLNKRKKLLNMKDDSVYFNSGVLLIDCQKWRDNDVINKILNVENDLRYHLLCPDQDLLNKVFDNNYKKLDLGYNLLNGHIHFNNSTLNNNNISLNPVIRHFEGAVKPWLSDINEFGDKIKYFEEFWFFAKMTPFYEGLLNDFMVYNLQNTTEKKIYKIFGILPIIKIKIKKNKSKIYLFNFIPLLTIKNK